MNRIGVFAKIHDEQNRIMCVKANYGNKYWAMPGGGLERGESPVDGTIREVLEETGYHVEIERLIGAYYIKATDNLVLSFAAKIVGQEEWQPNDEIAEVTFFHPEDLPENMAFNAKLRIEDAYQGLTGVMRVINSPDEVETYYFSKEE